MLSEAFDGMGSSGIDCSSGGSSHEVSTLALAQMRMENWICGGKRDDRGSNIHGQSLVNSLDLALKALIGMAILLMGLGILQPIGMTLIFKGLDFSMD